MRILDRHIIMNAKNNQRLWASASSYAYGANAVYIPESGKIGSLEFILVMYQNYPIYKSHPVLDVFHGYVEGVERYQKIHDFRVIAWDIDLKKRQWSFRYLPSLDNNIYADVRFVADKNGYLKMEIVMNNHSPVSRQWEFQLFCAPCEGVALPDYQLHSLKSDECCFEINHIDMRLIGKNITFKAIEECDSNFWINFPLNAEMCFDPYNSNDRQKKRLKISAGFIDIAADSSKCAVVEFLPDKIRHPKKKPEFIPSVVPCEELPYRHIAWEAIHNQQYTKSFNSEKMVLRHLPSRQWGCFWIWDNGMTAIGAVDFDQEYAEAIIKEMPDPEKQKEQIFSYGSFIITAIYALFELYNANGNITPVAENYEKLKKLSLLMFKPYREQDCDGLVTANRGSGADDSPALFYALGVIYSWDYQETLPTNKNHDHLTLICAGLTAHAIRQLKILRIFASLLDKKDDIADLTDKINTTEEKLNRNYWSNKYNCYLDRINTEKELLDIPWIYGYLPLFSGSVPESKKKLMLDGLFREGGYFTPNGLTIVEPASAYYRAEGYPNGSIWHPLQYLFWKACFSLGQVKLAKEIAVRYLALWDRHHPVDLCVWEHHRVNTGKGAGNARFSSFTTPTFSMYKAHRVPKSITVGHDLLIKSRHIDENCELAVIQLFSPFYSGASSLSIVMKPHCTYLVQYNTGEMLEANTDEYGWLGVDLKIEPQKLLTVNIVIEDMNQI